MARNLLTISLALALSPAMAQPVVKDAMATGEAVKLTAKIVAVDQATRTLTVTGPMGKTVTLKASDNVKNLAQIKAGDEVVLRYTEAMSVALEKNAVGRSETVTSSGPMTAAPGAKPAIGGVQTTTIVANVQSVDAKRQTVLLEGPNANYVEVKVKDPAVFSQVKPNDKVKITYTEAAVLDVETPKR
jgi:hypothetical protein